MNHRYLYIPEIVKETNRFGVRNPWDTFGRTYDNGDWPKISSKVTDNLMTFNDAVSFIELQTEKYELVWLCTRADKMFVLDIDDVKDHATIETFISKMDTYTEISRSGQGYHLIGTYHTLPEPFKSDTEKCGSKRILPCATFELYITKQITLTANIYQSRNTVQMRQKQFEELIPLFPNLSPVRTVAPVRTKTLSNEKVMNLMEKHNPIIHAAMYSRSSDTTKSASEMDFKIMSTIYFYCANESQMKELFQNCPRWTGDRQKKKGRDYIDITAKAVIKSKRGNFYGEKQ